MHRHIGSFFFTSALVLDILDRFINWHDIEGPHLLTILSYHHEQRMRPPEAAAAPRTPTLDLHSELCSEDRMTLAPTSSILASESVCVYADVIRTSTHIYTLH
jgi:hypothetical protein